MGQYFKIIFLSENGEFIRAYVEPWSYRCGSKLMEHAWVGTDVMNLVETLLSPEGMFYKSRIVWAGDYAEPEPIESKLNLREPYDDFEGPVNLYHQASSPENSGKRFSLDIPHRKYHYIVNHTKQEYVVVKTDRYAGPEDYQQVHPLPILTYEGETAYYGEDEELGGAWARDIISMEKSAPEGYAQLKCNFRE
jgi:hypothetical protein